MATIAIIGSGFAGISAAAYLAKAGHKVQVFEKNSSIGGRARQFTTEEGFVFDMGPSWYWMPDVFEKFFSDFGHTASDFYKLQLLDPGFEVVFKDKNIKIPANYEELKALFESLEEGSSIQLDKFMVEAEFKYRTGIENLVYKPGLSLTEFADINLIKGVFKLQVFSSFSTHVKKYFKNPKLIALMEFPVLFLGAMPKDTPALYSLMNYAGLKLGTWYPDGGFGKVISAMKQVAEKQGVSFNTNSVIDKIEVKNNIATHLIIKGEKLSFDAIIGSADYHHIENTLLPKKFRNYSEEYWNNKTFAPSALCFYLGINKKLENLEHHTLFFDEDLGVHSEEIYKTPKWPSKPLFYVCCPSKTDSSVAPEGHENLFLLMPIAPNLVESEELTETYFKEIIGRLESKIKQKVLPHIVYKKSYCIKNFKEDYNAYKGNAYGLANTLSQTAILKPSIRNKKVKNLFYAGQLTVPGPGVPPSIISGNVAAHQLINYLKK